MKDFRTNLTFDTVGLLNITKARRFGQKIQINTEIGFLIHGNTILLFTDFLRSIGLPLPEECSRTWGTVGLRTGRLGFLDDHEYPIVLKGINELLERRSQELEIH